MESGKLTAAADPDRPLFEATLRPHRSLGRQGFRIMMVVCSLVALAASVRMLVLGFWPVCGFIGLDLLGLFVAFRISYRRARAFEHLVLTRVELRVEHVSPAGRARTWRLNPLWTQMKRRTHEEFGLLHLFLVSGRTRVDVGRAIPPAELEVVARDLGAALAVAKRGY